jgi:hypothetical protein
MCLREIKSLCPPGHPAFVDTNSCQLQVAGTVETISVSVHHGEETARRNLLCRQFARLGYACEQCVGLAVLVADEVG